MKHTFEVRINKYLLTMIFKSLYLDIEHGDQDHRDWLRNKMDEHLQKLLSSKDLDSTVIKLIEK